MIKTLMGVLLYYDCTVQRLKALMLLLFCADALDSYESTSVPCKCLGPPWEYYCTVLMLNILIKVLLYCADPLDSDGSSTVLCRSTGL
ncbi:hypothetical protein XENTR_v10023863 [Xenopus tropicalis]|nr:hypothetical protein XENTR_v10023863 [Xenopus tropicalis]